MRLDQLTVNGQTDFKGVLDRSADLRHGMGFIASVPDGIAVTRSDGGGQGHAQTALFGLQGLDVVQADDAGLAFEQVAQLQGVGSVGVDAHEDAGVAFGECLLIIGTRLHLGLDLPSECFAIELHFQPQQHGMPWQWERVDDLDVGGLRVFEALLYRHVEHAPGHTAFGLDAFQDQVFSIPCFA